MSLKLVLPPLSAWAASRVTGLLESKTQGDFDSAFEGTFAAHCNITLNGKHLSRDEYKAQLLQQSAAAAEESGTVVNIEGQTEVEIGDQGQLSGLVGIFYTSLSDSKFLILGAPAENRATSSLNLVIEPTEKNPRDPNPRVRGGYFDPRRVVTVDQVVAESSYHVSIPAASVPKTTAGGKTELGPGPLVLPENYDAKYQSAFGGRFEPGPVRLPQQGPFGGHFGPGPVRLPPQGPFGGHFGPGPVRLPPRETGARPETLPGDGEFGVGPVIIPGETIGDSKA